LALTACSVFRSSPTPTETLKEYVEAAKAKDLAGVRNTVSKKTMKMMEELLVEKGSTLEETVQKNEPSIPPIFVDPEIRNEKIDGEKASLEIRNRFTGAWIEVPFVKEDGRWKLALGEQMDEMTDKFKSIEQDLEKTNKSLK
jgi:hypothetical protein